ncbi:MAG: hypothetical protein NZ518_03005 [Dehalococcoidia bacterium]|nr:hypothetical protein [Dehalococcoidia bacterium]
MLDVVLVTASVRPAHDTETPHLLDALARAGLRADAWAWDDPTAPWDQTRLAIVRATWDYHQRLDAFLGWIDQVERVTTLWNPPAVMRWNSHKRYLRDLAARGVPVVPTVIVRPDAAVMVAAVAEAVGWTTVVIKPAVSLGAHRTARFAANDPNAQAHLQSVLAEGDALLQPFLDSVAVDGETSLVHFDGAFSHAVLKRPAPDDFRVQATYGGVVAHYAPTSAELRVADRALAAVGRRVPYARVDLVPYRGRRAVMELELIEPALFFALAPGSVDRFAALIARQVAAAR